MQAKFDHTGDRPEQIRRTLAHPGSGALRHGGEGRNVITVRPATSVGWLHRISVYDPIPLTAVAAIMIGTGRLGGASSIRFFCTLPNHPAEVFHDR